MTPELVLADFVFIATKWAFALGLAASLVVIAILLARWAAGGRS